VRWIHVPVWVVIITLTGYVLVHLRAGRLWLAWTVCSLRSFLLFINFSVGQNLNFIEITRYAPSPSLVKPFPSPKGQPTRGCLPAN